MVAYNQKNNWANGEDNRDGIDDNLSWNSGVEGETKDEGISRFRKKRVKNFLTTLFISNGVPMLLSGDELGKSQKGNNNVYCMDNELSWFDWSLTSENEDLLRFAQKMIKFRKDNESLRRDEFFGDSTNFRGMPLILWHGCKLNSPGWDDPDAKVLAFTIASLDENQPDIHVMMNMHYEALDFELPQIEQSSWYRFSDTSLECPDDVADYSKMVKIESGSYVVNEYSIVVLINHK